MTQPIFATHEVFNQSPPFEDVNLFNVDRPLVESVKANGGTAAEQELSEFGRQWGSAAMAERGRVANESTPKLKTFDSRGSASGWGSVARGRLAVNRLLGVRTAAATRPPEPLPTPATRRAPGSDTPPG